MEEERKAALTPEELAEKEAEAAAEKVKADKLAEDKKAAKI